MNSHQTQFRRAVTLMEVMIVTLVISIAAVVVIPSASGNDPVTIRAASANLAADIEYAQAATVANPADPTVVVFDAPQNRYFVALASAPSVPIDRPGAPAGAKFDVRLADLPGADGLDLLVQGVGSHLRFDALGRLAQASDIVITFANPAGRIDVMIDAETGSVSALADASKEASVTTEVYEDPALRPAPPPEETEIVGPPADPALELGAVLAVDLLVSGSGASATSGGTATIGGVKVGIDLTPTIEAIETKVVAPVLSPVTKLLPRL